jgi:hypothetical protein
MKGFWMSVHVDALPWWRRPFFLGAGAVALLLGLGAAYWSGEGDRLSRVAEPVHGSGSGPQASAPGSPATGVAAGSGDLVEVDLLGARMDVSRLFQLGFGGGLTVDGDTRATLDTLMLQMSDPPSAQEAEKLEYTLRQGLPKEEAEKALKLLQGYRGYQTELRAEGAQLGIPETRQGVDEYFAQVSRIQRRHFDDATASALFGADIRNARAVMMAAVIDQDPNLSPEQKKAQIDALRAELPAEQRGIVPEPTAGAAPEAK